MTRLTIALLIALISAAPALAREASAPLVLLETTEGNIYLEMDRVNAPKTVANFLQYVREGQYEDVIFHRVIPGFMAQGGGYTVDFEEKKTRSSIENESKNGLSNARGSIAMARTNDPHSASAQWFINLVDNPRLDGKEYKWGYAVFGKVVRGMEIVDAIAKIPTGPGGPFQSDVPFRPVVIEKARIVEALPPQKKTDVKPGDE